MAVGHVWAAVLLLGGAAVEPPTEDDGRTVRFVVLGHEPHLDRAAWLALLDELELQLPRIAPDLAFLTGDWIAAPARSAEELETDWAELDERFSGSAVPVYRVPGERELPGAEERALWEKRYGVLPRAIRHEDVLFLMLSTVDGSGAAERELSGVQRAFLQAELEDADTDHTFVFAHAALWWERESSWWSDVHPLLAAGNVRAVFSADAERPRFANAEVDGVRYLLTRVDARLAADTFDHFVEVTVTGERVEYELRALAALERSGREPPDWPSTAGEPARATRRIDWREPGVLAWVLRISGAAFLAGVVLTLTVVTLSRAWRRQTGAR